MFQLAKTGCSPSGHTLECGNLLAIEIDHRCIRIMDPKDKRSRGSEFPNEEIPFDQRVESERSDSTHALQQRVNTPWLSKCCQAVNKLSTSCQEKKYFLPKHIFSSQQTKILTLTHKFPKIKTDENLRVAVRWLSRGCQEAVGWLSGKNHHNSEAKIKFGQWFRYHHRAYPTPSVLTPARFDLRFRLSRGCSPSDCRCGNQREWQLA